MYINVNKKWQPILDGAMIVVGCFVMGFAISIFFQPNDLSTGGFTGIAMIINTLLHKAGVTFNCTSLIYLGLNAVLYLIAIKYLGKRFAIYALLGIVACSGAIQIFALVPTFAHFDLIVSAIFGGAMLGFGVGLVVRFGGTTGGSDMVACVVRKKFPKVHIGRIVVAIDVLVVAMTLVVYKNGVDLLPYTIIALTINSFMMDFVIDGYKQTKAYTIITTKPDEITQGVRDTLYRSCTVSTVKGTYDNCEKSCLVCLIGKYQEGTMRQVIKDIDPKAFVYSVPVHEVIGQWRTDSQIREMRNKDFDESAEKKEPKSRKQKKAKEPQQIDATEKIEQTQNEVAQEVQVEEKVAKEDVVENAPKKKTATSKSATRKTKTKKVEEKK